MRVKERVSTAADLGAQVDATFARWNRDDTPGCAVGVVQDGELVLERYYGMTDLEHGVPLGPRSTFDIASTSKQFTAALTLLLNDDGALSLDEDVQAYLPELPEYEAPITIRHLLHHTSGIRDYLALRLVAGIPDSDYFDMQDVIDLVARQKGLNFPPGSRHLYSNSGYVLLAVIASRVTGRSFDELCRERIFAPLGMEHSRFREDATRIVPGMVQMYTRDPRDDSLRKMVVNDDAVGDGALLTTLGDLALWERNLVTGTVGGDGFAERMATPGTPEGDPERYGFGLSNGEHRGLRTVSHGGNLHGYSGEFLRFPDQGLCVMVLANLGGFDSPGLARQVAELYLGEAMAPASSPAPGGAPGAAGAAAAAAEPAEVGELVGLYRDRETGVVIELVLEEGTLTAVVVDRRVPLTPREGCSFNGAYLDFVLDVVFTPDDEGATVMRFDHEGQTLLRAASITTPALSESQLAEFAGEYCSDEVDGACRIALDGDALAMWRGRASRVPLRPTLPDEFSTSFGGLRFARDEDGTVSEFEASMARTRGVLYRRVPPPRVAG
jgi:CubicO group peptidase (beta-lactamase class C family)